jgi:hypothetical protein
MAAARIYPDVVTGHGADTERIDRAHGIEDAAIQDDPMACVPVAEGVGADNALAIENEQVATKEILKQRANGRLAYPRALGKRAHGRGSSVFGVELKQRNAGAVGGGVITAPKIEHMVGDHRQQSVSNRWRCDD